MGSPTSAITRRAHDSPGDRTSAVGQGHHPSRLPAAASETAELERGGQLVAGHARAQRRIRRHDARARTPTLAAAWTTETAAVTTGVPRISPTAVVGDVACTCSRSSARGLPGRGGRQVDPPKIQAQHRKSVECYRTEMAHRVPVAEQPGNSAVAVTCHATASPARNHLPST